MGRLGHIDSALDIGHDNEGVFRIYLLTAFFIFHFISGFWDKTHIMLQQMVTIIITVVMQLHGGPLTTV